MVIPFKKKQGEKNRVENCPGTKWICIAHPVMSTDASYEGQAIQRFALAICYFQKIVNIWGKHTKGILLKHGSLPQNIHNAAAKNI